MRGTSGEHIGSVYGRFNFVPQFIELGLNFCAFKMDAVAGFVVVARFQTADDFLGLVALLQIFRDADTDKECLSSALETGDFGHLFHAPLCTTFVGTREAEGPFKSASYYLSSSWGAYGGPGGT